ncbi:MAG: class D sortase [Oscillospiraceae bacterium]|nr:class D sortase [Oscillospiraceae bacterium]
MKQKRTRKQRVLFLTGSAAIMAGCSIMLFYGGRKLYRMHQKQMLMRENPVVEIADLNIKAPVLEGTDQQTIAKAVGHFTGTGDFGSGNYCIAGHSSTIYKEYFNKLKDIENGMTITLYDTQKKHYDYTVSDSFVVEPDETWVLDDTGDNRITLITCTDDGTQRLVVTGICELQKS